MRSWFGASSAGGALRTCVLAAVGGLYAKMNHFVAIRAFSKFIAYLFVWDYV